MSQSPRKKRARTDEDESSNENGPEMIKRPRKEEKEKKVLVFLDLGDRKGCPFPPKLFGIISERKWNIISLELEEEPEYEIFIRGDNGIQFPIYNDDCKIVIKESDEPERFTRMHDILTHELKQKLGDIHFDFSNLE